MADEPLQAEVERLRAEIESYRQRELEDLRSQLAAARQEAAHYKSEAYRNADLGQQIAAHYEQQLAALKTQLEAARNLHVSSRRPVINASNN